MQLFVVTNPKTDATWIFDNHDAALCCRTEQGLSQDSLIGCVLMQDWVAGKPVVRKDDVVKMAIEAPTFNGVVTLTNRVCTEASHPRLMWMVGSGQKGIEGYCRGRKWKVEELREDQA